MKCLDNEEKSECSQVVKLKLKLILLLSWLVVCGF